MNKIHIRNIYSKKKEEEYIFFIIKNLPVVSQQCLFDLQKKSTNILLVYKPCLKRFRTQCSSLYTKYFTICT